MEGMQVDFSFYYQIMLKNGWAMDETEFCILDDVKYHHCWMGYLPESMDFHQGKWHRRIHDKPYWMGLTSDGKESYHFYTADEMIHAPVFRGQSLMEIWPRLRIYSIAGRDTEGWILEQKNKHEKED